MAKKKKIKGLSYISSVLKKYASKKYRKLDKNTRDKASDILSKLKENNQKVTIKNILSYVRKKRVDKFIPKLPPDMDGVRDYFELINYPDYIITEVDPKITLVSKVSKKGLPIIRGGDEIEYSEYFADFVIYCNRLMQDQETYEGSGNIFVTCELIDEKKYAYQIISCDKNGNEVDYGFNTENPDLQPSKDKLIEVKKGENKEEKPEEKPKEEKPNTELDREIELSKQRQKESEQKEKESESQRKLIKERLDAVKELKSLGFSNDDIIKMLG